MLLIEIFEERIELSQVLLDLLFIILIPDESLDLLNDYIYDYFGATPIKLEAGIKVWLGIPLEILEYGVLFTPHHQVELLPDLVLDLLLERILTFLSSRVDSYEWFVAILIIQHILLFGFDVVEVIHLLEFHYGVILEDYEFTFDGYQVDIGGVILGYKLVLFRNIYILNKITSISGLEKK